MDIVSTKPSVAEASALDAREGTDDASTLIAWQSVQAEARRLLHRDELRELHRTNPWAVAEVCLLTWGVILASIWAWAVTHNPLVGVAAFVVIATRQHALNTIVHEGAHWGFSKNRARNDRVCDLFIAAPHFITTAGYRDKHMLHHSKLGNHEFDYERKARYLIRGWHFFKMTAIALFGGGWLGAVQTYLPVLLGRSTGTEGQQAPASVEGGRSIVAHGLMVLGTQAALFGYCAWLGAPLAYFTLWLLPLSTLTLYINMLRVMAEHQPFAYAQAGVENMTEDLPPYTRTIPAGIVERWIFSPLFFGYHHEHHLFPQIPFTNLRRTYELLTERGYYAAHPDYLATSYVATLWRLIFPRKATV